MAGLYRILYAPKDNSKSMMFWTLGGNQFQCLPICLCFEEIFEIKSFLVEPETLNTKSPKFKPQWNQVLEIVAPSNSKEKNVATSGLFKLTRLGLDMSTFWRIVTPPTRQHFRIPPADRLSKGWHNQSQYGLASFGLQACRSKKDL